MNFDEWMTVSEPIIGKEGIAIFKQFVLGNISYEDCLSQMYEAVPKENMEALRIFMEVVNTKDLDLGDRVYE